MILDESQKRKSSNSKLNKRILSIILGVILIIGFSYFFLLKEKSNRIDTASLENQVSMSSLPIILIFPISVLSNVSETKAFGSAITESMISSLSKFGGISVMSSSASFHAENLEFTDEEIQKNYNADYVVRGSIQTFGQTSRINATLADLNQRKVVWSEKVDFDTDEIFQVQDQLSNNLLSHLQIDVVTGSSVRSWAAELGTLDRLTMFLNSRNEWRKFTPEGYRNSNAITDDLASELGEDNIIIMRQRAYNLFLKLRMNLSENPNEDKSQLKKILNIVNQPQYIGTADALSLRGISELVFYSRDCKIARSFTKRSIEANASVDSYTTAGVVDFLCKDYPSSIQNFESALRLVPNDNDWFITRYLGATLYNANKTKAIIELLQSNIDAVDMPPNLLAYYSYAMLQVGNEKSATKYFDLAKSKGLSEKYLTRFDMSKKVFDDFKVKMQSIGSIQ